VSGHQRFSRQWRCSGAFREFGVLCLLASASSGGCPALSRSATGLATLAAGFRGEFAILRETPPFRRNTFAALAPGLCRETRILRETSLLGRDALAAFARYGALFRLIHRSKTAIGRALTLVIPRHDVSFLKNARGRQYGVPLPDDNGPIRGTVPTPHRFFER